MRFFVSLLALVLVPTVPVAAGTQALERSLPRPEGHVRHLVVEAEHREAIPALDARLGTRTRRLEGRTYAVRLRDGADVNAALEAFERAPGVLSVREAHTYRALRTPNDPRFGEQYHLDRIQAPQAWDLTTGGSRVIAVVDTGVEDLHQDLSSKTLPGRDFVNGDDDASDDNGHGTFVAGIAAAATDNSRGVAGVTWSDTILPVKALDADGVGDDVTISEGIRWAADQGADVINLSLGAPEYSSLLDSAVAYARSKGALVVAGSGNDGLSHPSYPAALPGVVSVGATDQDDEIPLWGSDPLTGLAAAPNYGSTIDVVAPGTELLGPASSDLDSDGRLDDYHQQTGTSAAAPVVAGLAALVWARNPGFTADQVAARIRATADDLGLPGHDRYFGAGRINAYRAVGGNPSQPAGQDEPPGEPANTLESASPIAGAAAGTIYPSGDRDWYEIDVPDDGWLDLTVDPPAEIDPYIEIYGPDLGLVDIVDEVFEGETESATLDLGPGGTYYIGIRNYYPNASQDPYSIEAASGADPAPPGAFVPEGIERALSTWYDAVNSGRRNWLMTANVSDEASVYLSTIDEDLVRADILDPGEAGPAVFGGLVGGPVETRWLETAPMISSQRVLWRPDNFEEVPAVLEEDLTTNAWFSWYDGVNTSNKDWVLAANPGPWATTAEIRFEGAVVASGTLDPGDTLIWSDRSAVGGPVEVVSDLPVLASRRTLWASTNFSELTGVPGTSLSHDYVFPWYDAVVTSGRNWIMLSNPNDTAIGVRVRIGSQVDQTVQVPAGGTVTPRFPGVVGGPVRVTGIDPTKDFVATQRTLFDAGRSFEEVAGVPVATLPTRAAFSWYDAVNTQNRDWILVANPDASASIDVEIRIGGTLVFDETVGPGAVRTPRFPGVVDGPVEVTATGPLVTSRRTLWRSDFTELLGVPLS